MAASPAVRLGCPEEAYIVAILASQATDRVQLQVSQTSNDFSTKYTRPSQHIQQRLEHLELRARTILSPCADLTEKMCGVEFVGAGVRAQGRWLEEVGLDGLGLRVRPRAGCGLVSTALVVSGFQGWRASYLSCR